MYGDEFGSVVAPGDGASRITYLAWRYSSITFRSFVNASDSGTTMDDIEREATAVMRERLRQIVGRITFMFAVVVLFTKGGLSDSVFNETIDSVRFRPFEIEKPPSCLAEPSSCLADCFLSVDVDGSESKSHHAAAKYCDIKSISNHFISSRSQG
jgi:hypothetical protein